MPCLPSAQGSWPKGKMMKREFIVAHKDMINVSREGMNTFLSNNQLFIRFYHKSNK